MGAAHCIEGFSASDVKTLRIYLGAHDIKSGSDGRSEHRVIRIIKHKDFDPKTLVIAILTLETPARISSTIKSVCLPSFHDNYDTVSDSCGLGCPFRARRSAQCTS